MATIVRMIEIFTFEEEKRSPQRIKKIDSSADELFIRVIRKWCQMAITHS